MIEIVATTYQRNQSMFVRFAFSLLLLSLLANPLVGQDEAETAKESTKPESSEVESNKPESSKPESSNSVSPDNNSIRLHMWDGLILGGELPLDAIDMETEFGTLRIPINKIQKFYPGLDGMPSMQQKIENLVEGLGDKNFDVREKSHNELVAMGGLLSKEIQRFEDGGSAERKKHLTEIKAKIEEISIDESENGDIRPLIRGDFVQTSSFAVVGKIIQREFRLKSQFGEMVVQLADIKMGDRTFGLAAADIRKTTDIEATTFFPTGMSTKIRVNRGDKVIITASGTVQWTNWNSSCGPDGLTDKGQFKGFNGGLLLARIGDKEDYVKIGSKGEFIAKSSGELFLGIALADNFREGGYTWTGKYTAKILVKPQTATK